MANAYRLDQIYKTLLSQGSATVEELARVFHVTPTTIRRDLLVLEERSLIYRTRGSVYIQDSTQQREADLLQDEKKRIAKAAASFIAAGMSIVLDSGNTMSALVSHLGTIPFHRNLDIVTHSPQIALQASEHFKVSIPGGSLLPKSDFMVGIELEQYYQNINVDVAVMGSTGVNNCTGLTVSYPLQLPVKKYACACANKRIALLDSSKYVYRGVYVFCDFNHLDTLITVETEENKAQLDRIAKYGVEIILV